MTTETLTLISSYVLGAGAICVAITNVAKFLSPLTTAGKKKVEERKKEREENVKIVVDQTIQSYVTDREKKLGELSASLAEMKDKLQEVADLNERQSAYLSKLDEKIDLNEIDRLRWEILSFSNELRRGHQPQQDEFRHIFKIYKKYEDTLSSRSMTNGEVDTEYQFIQDAYLHSSKENLTSKEN